MSTGNKNYGVGGTAQDGGLSTADTVRDGGPDAKESDGTYQPTGGASSGGTSSGGSSSGGSSASSNAGPGNPNYGVGGTAEDGGLSTEATVADGGPDDQEADGEYKPS